MKPIEKNIIVTDEQGNEYEATYPKRAKGLVKNGRARFVSENKICLACPPNKTLEDIKMSNKNIAPEDIAMVMTDEINEALAQNLNADVGEIIRETIKKQVEVETAKENTKSPEKPSMEYALEQIEKIASQIEYLNQVISKLRQMETGGAGDIGNANKAEALSDIVKCRETTNQQLLRIYEKMYDDLKPQPQASKLKDILTFIGELPPAESKDALLEIYNDTKPNVASHYNEIINLVKSLNRDEFDSVTWDAITQSIQAQLSRNW